MDLSVEAVNLEIHLLRKRGENMLAELLIALLDQRKELLNDLAMYEAEEYNNQINAGCE